jgi:6-phospho-3-hexuloisomerase
MSSSLEMIGAEIAAVLAAVDEQQLAEAERAIRGTRGAITTTGQGRSGLVATMTAMRFMHLGLAAHAAAEATAPAITKDDLLLVVSGSGATPVSLRFVTVARSVGTRVVLVTRKPDSAIGVLADHVIHVPVETSVQPGGSLFEQCALLALDAIVRNISLSIPDPVTQLRSRHTNLL